jgi:fructokinase
MSTSGTISVASIQGRKALYGAIEGGGTRFVCAVAEAPDRILARVAVPTTDPRTTLTECARFFMAAESSHGPIAAFGLGCFGPIELSPDATDFGRLLATPKPGWSGADVLAPLRSAFAAPMALDTDVGAAALAEWRIGAGGGTASLAYVTVGTGIGGAVAPQDRTRRRLMHAELGHLPAVRDPRDAGFAGVCPFHGSCIEGLASGLANPRALGLRSRCTSRGARRTQRRSRILGAARSVDRTRRIGRAHRARRRRDVERCAPAARERGNARIPERLLGAAP